MAEVLLVLQLAIEIAFALLAIRTVAAWVHQPERRHGNLAIALGSLAVVMLLSPLLSGVRTNGQVITDLAVVAFLVSGYGLLMFRSTFVPFGAARTRLVTALIVAIGVFDIAVQLPADPESSHTPMQSLALVATVGVWAFCILEPIITFWIASRGRPEVEKARLRAISLGYAGLLMVILVGTVAGSLSSGLTVIIDLFALATVPVLYVAFFPPVWLRRIWRQPEEDQFRHALHDLLLYSPDRATLAERALGWAERLVGGDAAFVLDSDGSVLAARGISTDEATALTATSSYLTVDGKGDGHAPWRTGPSLVVPLDLRQGGGAMVIVSGRLTPLFGDDELGRLHQYAASITAGLDRVTLSSKIAALERAKTDFLNVASHELRGPMTVIKGYLTMLEAGALGELSPKARSVLPLLISKSDEVNWMVEQMIEASRLEEGRLALKRQQTDIVELTDSAIEGVRMLLNDHELKVDSPVEAIEAVVDPDRFQIVVRNLLSNAAKYSPSGTDISVDVRRVDGNALVSVTDQGSGNLRARPGAAVHAIRPHRDLGPRAGHRPRSVAFPRDRAHARRRSHRLVAGRHRQHVHVLGAGQPVICPLWSRMPQGRFEPVRPLDLRLTLAPLGAGPWLRHDGGAIWRATRTPAGPTTMRLERTNGSVDVSAWGSGAEWAVGNAPGLCGEQDDDSGFAPAHPLVGRLHREMRGVRMTRTLAVFETLVPTILGQQVTTEEARESYRHLVNALGEKAPGPYALKLPPSPEVLSRTPYWAFHRFGIERRRADVIIRTARSAKRLEQITSMDMPGAYARLQAFPASGCGRRPRWRWSRWATPMRSR